MSPSESFHGNPRFLPPVTSARGRKPGALHRQPWPPARGLHRGHSARLRPAPSLLLSGPGASSSCCGRGGGPPLGTAPLRRLRGAVSVARTVGTGTAPASPPLVPTPDPWGLVGTGRVRRTAAPSRRARGAEPQPRPDARGLAPRTRQSVRQTRPSLGFHPRTRAPLCKAKQEVARGRCGRHLGAPVPDRGVSQGAARGHPVFGRRPLL